LLSNRAAIDGAIAKLGVKPSAPIAADVGRRALALPDKPSIAVLSFTNMTGDPDREYFGDGIAEDIITTLSRSPSVFVIARNSCFTYKGRAVDVKQIGRELGVRYVLEGSIRRGGNRIRITAQLIEAETGNHLWAERYDRDLNDIFAVHDEITEAVATAIEPTIAHIERHRAARKVPENLGAWEAYQRGQWHLSRISAADNETAENSSVAQLISIRISQPLTRGWQAQYCSEAGSTRCPAQRKRRQKLCRWPRGRCVSRSVGCHWLYSIWASTDHER
jgi:TolB-like protein